MPEAAESKEVRVVGDPAIRSLQYCYGAVLLLLWLIFPLIFELFLMKPLVPGCFLAVLCCL